jgi:hypothetical protein
MTSRVLSAAALYFALVFLAGFILGTLRTLLIAPSVGPLIAVLLELPVMLGAAWVICTSVILKFRVPEDLSARLLMGAAALTMLLAAELALAVWLFGTTVASFIAHYREPDGILGLLGQIAFAFIPALQKYGSRG